MGPNESHFMTLLLAIFFLWVFDSWVPINQIDLSFLLSKLGIHFLL